MGDVTVSDGTSTTVQPLNAGCYQYSCNTTGVYVTVGSTEYECRNRGDVVTVEERVGGDTYTFSLICPSCESICWDRLELCGNRTSLTVIQTVDSKTFSPDITISSNSSEVNQMSKYLILTIIMVLVYNSVLSMSK